MDVKNTEILARLKSHKGVTLLNQPSLPTCHTSFISKNTHNPRNKTAVMKTSAQYCEYLKFCGFNMTHGPLSCGLP